MSRVLRFWEKCFYGLLKFHDCSNGNAFNAMMNSISRFFLSFRFCYRCWGWNSEDFHIFVEGFDSFVL
jgi:hypothetical protein